MRLDGTMRLAAALRGRLLYRRFYEIKVAAHGMMPARVYKRLYDTVLGLPDLDIVEIGAAGGAGSVVIAQALKDARRTARLVTVEKCEGGSRSGRSKQANRDALEATFRRFQVGDRIALFPEHLTMENGEEVKRLIGTGAISALVHDADGRLDRDFRIFFDMLVDGGAVVIDDFVDRRRFKPVCDRYPFGGTKKLRTFRLANQLIDWGLIKREAVVGHTLFARKVPGASAARIEPEVVQAIDREVRAEYEQWRASQH